MKYGFPDFRWNTDNRSDDVSFTETFKTKVAFGLGFSIAKSGDTLSGFEPGEYDKGIDVRLFSRLRLEGFAGLMSGKFAEKLVIVSGQWKVDPSISQAVAIRDMLVRDFDIDPEKVEALSSVGNTNGNIGAIKAYIDEHQTSPYDCAAITSHYHVPRALTDFVRNGFIMPMISAEAALFASTHEGAWESLKDMVRNNFGESPYTERELEEITGIARKMQGTFFERKIAAA